MMSETTETTPTPGAGGGRLATGVPGLDALLGGGLLPRRTVLVKGAPGSGKTTLGLQFLVAGATQHGEPGVLISFEQRPEQFHEDAARFGWNLAALAEDHRLTTIFVTPEQVLQNEGRQSHQLLIELADLVEDHGTRRLVIDSISHLAPMLAAGGGQARANLLKFLNALKTLGLTPMLTGELAGAEDLMGLEAYLVDAILVLDQAGITPGSGPASGRTIQVYKGRGLAHLSGRHPMEIGPRGIVVYPHSYPGEDASGASAGDEPAGPTASLSDGSPLGSGVAGLDALLGGGYAPGSAILVAGLSGTFKTTVAARFLLADGAPGLWISFQESRDALARRFGVEALGNDGRIDVIEAIPGRQSVEKLFSVAAGQLAVTGARRVVVDGLGDLAVSATAQDEPAREETARWFLRNLRALGVTTLATQQLSRLTGRNPMTAIAWPELADTIIYLGLVEIESRLEHVISVLKHRGGAALGDLRAVTPLGQGELLAVSDRFVGLSGVLGGTPLGRRKAQIEEIFQPMYFIRDFLALARDPQLDPARREAMLANLSAEAQRLIDLLGKHFDQPDPKGEKEKS
jgi:circadian clock protein KaiC